MARIASYLGHSGTYAAARDLWQKIANARAEIAGSDHPHTLAAHRGAARWTEEAERGGL